jgi:4'-phosphopantetheinyl transferase
VNNDLLYHHQIEWLPYRWQHLSVEKCNHIFMIDINSNFGKITDFDTVLSPQETAKARRFIKQEDRNNFLVRRYTLRLILGVFLQQAPAEIRFQQSANKKPSVPNIYFNTSHTSNFAVIALSAARIGTDIETVRPDFEFRDLLTHCFSLQESTYISSAADMPKSFFTLWTRKEALLKASGEGIVDNLQQVDSMSADAERNGVGYRLQSSCNENRVLSIASSGTSAEMNYWII